MYFLLAITIRNDLHPKKYFVIMTYEANTIDNFNYLKYFIKFIFLKIHTFIFKFFINFKIIFINKIYLSLK